MADIIIILFLGLIALGVLGPHIAEAVRSERGKEKLHIKEKQLIALKKMWDLKFLVAKMKAMREGFRVEYDRLAEMVDAANLKTEELNKTEKPDEQTLKNLAALIERYTPDIEQLRKQMQSIDAEIEGFDSPEGRKEGLNEAIDGYRTVVGLLGEHLKKI